MAAEGSERGARPCTLPAGEQPLRAAEFGQLLAVSVLRCDRVAPTRVDLVLSTAAEATARDLAAREAACCSFFTFAFTTCGSEVVMSIVVPQACAPVLDELMMQADGAIAARPGP